MLLALGVLGACDSCLGIPRKSVRILCGMLMGTVCDMPANSVSLENIWSNGDEK